MNEHFVNQGIQITRLDKEGNPIPGTTKKMGVHDFYIDGDEVTLIARHAFGDALARWYERPPLPTGDTE